MRYLKMETSHWIFSGLERKLAWLDSTLHEVESPI
jgi:hypothetical protein